VLAELGSRRAGLEERLRTGIEPEAREKLLDELRRVYQEIYARPWRNVVEPMERMRAAYASAVAELRTVGAQLASLRAQEEDLFQRRQAITQAEGGARALERQISRLSTEFGAVHREAQSLVESAQQWQAEIEKRIPQRLGDTALDPRPVARQMETFRRDVEQARRQLDRAMRAEETNETAAGLVGVLGMLGGQIQELERLLGEYARHWEQVHQEVRGLSGSIESEVKRWRSFQREVQEHGQEGRAALRPLQDLETGLQELRDAVESLQRLLGRYNEGVFRTVQTMTDLVGRSEGLSKRIGSHLDDRQQALDKSRRDLDRLQDEYYRGIEREKARVGQEIAQLKARQAQLEWMETDPEQLVAELAGYSVERAGRLDALAHGARVEETIAGQVEGAIESARTRIEAECQRRIDALYAAQQAADGAVQLVPGSGGDADLLLVPLWYVEWRKTLDPEQPERKRLCYRLATPLGIVFKAGGERVEGELYPALTRYLQGLPGLGPWEGDFVMGREPSSLLAAQARRHACLQDREIERLAAGMREAVARGVYPADYAQMVDKSRDDLGEWRVLAGQR
jgi:chromosome segregation ATPase